MCSCYSGPYGLLFASFVHFFLNIPASSKFVFLGLKLNDKVGMGDAHLLQQTLATPTGVGKQ
jgi:hypothetical protein